MRKNNRLGAQQRPHLVECHLCGVCKDEGSLKAQRRTIQNMSSMTDRRPVCLEFGGPGKGWYKMRRERKASAGQGEDRIDHVEGLEICSDYTRKPLEHLK